jgi:hypothetical protein
MPQLVTHVYLHWGFHVPARSPLARCRLESACMPIWRMGQQPKAMLENVEEPVLPQGRCSACPPTPSPSTLTHLLYPNCQPGVLPSKHTAIFMYCSLDVPPHRLPQSTGDHSCLSCRHSTDGVVGVCLTFHQCRGKKGRFRACTLLTKASS